MRRVMGLWRTWWRGEGREGIEEVENEEEDVCWEGRV